MRMTKIMRLSAAFLLFGSTTAYAGEAAAGPPLTMNLWPGGVMLLLAAFTLGVLAATLILRRRERDSEKGFQEVLNRAESLNTELQDLVAQHELLLDIMPIYVYAEDANDQYRHVFCNRICGDLWGRPIEEVMGKNDAELFGDSEEIRRFQETDAAVVASGELHESLQPFTGKDGKRHMGRFFRKGIDLSGGRRWMFGLVVDVTEEHDQRSRLNAMLEIFEYAFDLTKSAVFRYDPETREMTGANSLGGLWPIRDGKAIPREEVIYPDDLENFSELLESLISGKRENAALDYRSAYFGDMRYYRIKAGVDRETYGKFSLIGVIQDVTEITKNVWKLQETMALQDIIVNSMPTMFFARNANDDFRYVLVNRSLADFMGRAPDELIGRNDIELRGSPLAKSLSDQEVMEMPEGVELEEKLYDAEGVPHVFQVLKKPFVGLHGERLLLGVASDVTELSELNANQETLNVCLSGLLARGEAGFNMEPVLKEIGQRLNASICYLLRYDMERKTACPEAEWRIDAAMPSSMQVSPEPFTDDDVWFRLMNTDELIFAPDVDDPETIKRFGLWPETNSHFGLKSLYAMRVVMDGKTWGSFGVAYREKHTLTPYETDFVRSAGSLIGLVQQRKRDAEQLRTALEQAQSADRAKSYFLASMSHEIRTPLNAVIGFAELLADGTLPPEEQKDYLASISSAGNTLLALINDVLDLSKLEAGQMQFSPSETDFAELVGEVGAIFRQKCTEKKLKFAVAIGELPRVWLDTLRIRQILFNLIGNAVKFTDAGEIRVTASFAPESAERGTLTFRVADTGVGISEEDQKRLFQMFVQSNALRGTEAARNGTGLGLAIVRRMIERMNGAVQLESAPGQGSTFIVTIRDMEYHQEQKHREALSAALAAPDSPVRGSVLLVDDVAMNLKVISAMLHKLGIEAVMASSAEEALKVLETGSFDFLLTDLWMPGMNGAELAARLRRDPRYAKMRMAAVTADTENGERLDISLFDAVIAKPVTLEKLRAFLAG